MVKIVCAIEAIAEHEGVVENRFGALQHVEHIGRGGASQQQRTTGGGVYNAVPCVDGYREHRTRLPLKHVFLGVALLPNFCGATAFHHQVDFFVHVLFGMQCTCTRHFHHIATPLGFCAVQLNEMALATRTLPRHQGQVLNFVDTHIAKHWDPLRFHESVVGCWLFFENAITGFLVAGGFVPVAGVFIVRHAMGPSQIG